MEFLQERQSRRYFTGLALFLVCLLLFGIYSGWLHGSETRRVLMEREKAMVSFLIEQGVPAETVAAALKNDVVTETGDIFMRQAGHTEQTAWWLLPDISRTTVFLCIVILTGLFIFGLAVMIITILFLRARERRYQDAEGTITQFMDGNFQKHLSGNDTGALSRMFASIDQLATALQTKNETEYHAKVFLKDTISDISHQLKTPLAALAMYMEIILDEPENAAAVKNFSGKAVCSLERMEQLIQTLLKAARLDAGNIVFEKRPYPVPEIVSRATDNFLTRVDAEGKKLVIKGNSAEMVTCDLVWTGEAVGNLVKNALDHTTPGGTVCIAWERSPAMLRLSVADDGCGIAQEEIYHIFKRFYRGKYSKDRQSAGLGLSLSKAIVEGQGGILSVQSTCGVGTTFMVTFFS